MRLSPTFCWLALVISTAVSGCVTPQAPVTVANVDVMALKSAIGQFELDNGFYPSSLKDLVSQPPQTRSWHGPYIDPPKPPVDPWGNPYIYHCPGTHGPDSYGLLSAGPDGKEGTSDDIVSWK